MGVCVCVCVCVYTHTLELQERELFVRDIRDVIARKHGRAFGSAAWMRGVPCVPSGWGRGCKRGVSAVLRDRAIQAL